MIDLTRLKELERAATRGPWDYDDVYEITLTPHQWPANRALIAELRTAAPALIAAAERVPGLESDNANLRRTNAELRLENERLRVGLDEIRDTALRDGPLSQTARIINAAVGAALVGQKEGE